MALQVLDHALHPGGEAQDLPVGAVLQAADGGDLVPHGEHRAGLLREDLRGPVPHGVLHHGEDGLPPGGQQRQPLPQLAQAALNAPVVEVGAHLDLEAPLQRRVPLPAQGHFLPVGLVQESQQALALGLAGLLRASEDGLAGGLLLLRLLLLGGGSLPGSLIGGALRLLTHGSSPSPPGPGTGHRGRPWTPAAASPWR